LSVNPATVPCRWPRCLLLVIALICSSWAWAESGPIPRHPLELEALTDARGVLQRLPTEIDAATRAGDTQKLALLQLAKANACRIIADWKCQRAAGEAARSLGAELDNDVLQARGLIALARANISMGEFHTGERALSRAEALLLRTPVADLLADVYLGYSSFSFRIGRHALSADYAERGLAALDENGDAGMRLRLLRNQAKALGRLQRWAEAHAIMRSAEIWVARVDDPKLHAEIALEAAVIAHAQGDGDTQRRKADEILAIAQQLDNRQLFAVGQQTHGLADLQDGRSESAARHFAIAADTFAELGLLRDEAQAVAHYLRVAEVNGEMKVWLLRHINLTERLDRSSSALVAEEFKDRLGLAEQELALVRLEAESAREKERAERLAWGVRLGGALAFMGALLLIAMIAFALQLRRWNARLRAENELRHRALVQTSHELRNPLAGILGIAGLLEKASLQPPERQQLDALRSGAEHLLELSQDLLDRGRLEAGKLVLRPTPIDLLPLLQEIGRQHEPLANRRGLGFDLVLKGPDPGQVLIDPTRLRQVLGNLLGNALKFTEQGRIRLLAQFKTGPAGASRMQFAIEDSGPGLSPEDLAQLFVPFGKGKAGHRHRDGAGLGLAIASDLVELMGGKLQASSSADSGARFEFEIPLRKVGDTGEATPIDPAELRRWQEDAGDLNPRPPLRISLIDDDPLLQTLQSTALASLGASVQCFSSVEQCINAGALGSAELILVDYELRSGEGPPAVRAGLLRERALGVQVLVVSAHPVPDTLPDGVDEWLQKPVSLARWRVLLARADALRAAVTLAKH
jgi:signal transduction histidine kinase/CheY-like chemotaxis protein